MLKIIGLFPENKNAENRSNKHGSEKNVEKMQNNPLSVATDSAQVHLGFLEQQLLNLLLDGGDLGLDLGPLILGHAEQKEFLNWFLENNLTYLAAMTGLLTPQALPRACLDLTNT